MRKAVLGIQGISSSRDVMLVTDALSKMPGVINVEMPAAEPRVDIIFDHGQISADQLRAAIEEAGFLATGVLYEV